MCIQLWYINQNILLLEFRTTHAKYNDPPHPTSRFPPKNNFSSLQYMDISISFVRENCMTQKVYDCREQKHSPRLFDDDNTSIQWYHMIISLLGVPSLSPLQNDEAIISSKILQPPGRRQFLFVLMIWEQCTLF